MGGTCLPLWVFPCFLPVCSHLRGHLGNQMTRQAQGRASEAPQLRSGEGRGACRPGAGPPGLLHLSSHPPLTRGPSATGTVCHPVLERQEMKRA